MNNKLVCLIAFIAGAGVGSVVTWKLVKDKYQQIAKEEIAAIDDLYSKKIKKSKDEFENEYIDTESMNSKNAAELAKEKPSVIEFAGKIMEQEKYVAYDKFTKPEDTPTEPVVVEPYEEESDEIVELIEDYEGENPYPQDKPYVIAPEYFAEFESYSTVSLVLYSDGALVDDNDNIFDDADEIIGTDYINHFGDFEEDAVHIRNDIHKCDYEILKDPRQYSQIVKRNLRRIDD